MAGELDKVAGVRVSSSALRVDPGEARPDGRRVLAESLGDPTATGVKVVDRNPWPQDVSAVPDLNEIYTRPASRRRTVAVLGASSSKPDTARFEPWAGALAARIVAAGGNIVSGCGHSGIMGAAFDGAADATGRPGAGENLTILRVPAWGDEDLQRGRAIGVAASETRRVEKFLRVADTVVAFPGGAGTLLELGKLIFSLAYPDEAVPLPEKIVLVGRAYWAGLALQLETMVAAGQIEPEVANRLRWVESEAELLEAVPDDASA